MTNAGTTDINRYRVFYFIEKSLQALMVKSFDNIINLYESIDVKNAKFPRDHYQTTFPEISIQITLRHCCAGRVKMETRS